MLTFWSSLLGFTCFMLNKGEGLQVYLKSVHGIERLVVRSIAKGVSLSSNPNKSKFVKGTIFSVRANYYSLILCGAWGRGGGVLLDLGKKWYFVNMPPKSLSFVKVLVRADLHFQLKNAFYL